MNSQQLLNKAERNGCNLEYTCVSITARKWDELMEHSTRADKKIVTKIAMLAGVIDEEEARKEIRMPYYNPYNHYKTPTHAVYVHSMIEYFIRVH